MFPLLDLPLVLLSLHLLLLLLLVKLLHDDPSLLLLQCDFLQQSLLLPSVSLELLLLSLLHLQLVLLYPLLHLHLVLLSDSQFLFLLCSVVLHLSLSVIIHLIEKVDSGLLTFLPILLLLSLLFEPFQLNQSVKFFLIGKHILTLAPNASQSPPGFLSFLLLHQLFVLCQLPLLLDNSFNHESVSFFFLSDKILFLKFNQLIFLMNSLQSISLMFVSLFLLEFGQF